MKLGMRLTLDEAMLFAIEQAKLGAPFVSPNPQVGCVILNHQRELIGYGHHQKYGEAHAEINALKNLSRDQLQGAHVIVTLEPCAHQGKTGSCAKKLMDYPLSQVTYGLQDPFPQVAGQGAAMLNAAGINCRNYSSPSEIPDANTEVIKKLHQVCEVFLKNVIEQKPFIAVKLAQSLDGKMSLENGQSKWITSTKSRHHAHYLRSIYDVLIVGADTVLFDDPSLDIRDQEFPKQNHVLIIDPLAKTREKKLRLLESHAKEKVFWAVSAKELRNQNQEGDDPQVLAIKTNSLNPGPGQQFSNGFDLEDLRDQLWQRGFKSAMIEGGAQTISSFLQSGIVDRLHVFQSPKILGGSGGGWTSTIVQANVQNAMLLDVDESFAIGPDFYFTGRLQVSKE